MMTRPMAAGSGTPEHSRERTRLVGSSGRFPLSRLWGVPGDRRLDQAGFAFGMAGPGLAGPGAAWHGAARRGRAGLGAVWQGKESAQESLTWCGSSPMAFTHTRKIHPGFFLNEALADLPASTRLLFIGLWTLADREGRLQDRPRRIAAQIFPYESYHDETSVDTMLTSLDTNGFILRYMVNNQPFIQITNFIRYQQPHQRESPSKIPAPEPNMVRDEPRIDLGIAKDEPRIHVGSARVSGPREPGNQGAQRSREPGDHDAEGFSSEKPSASPRARAGASVPTRARKRAPDLAWESLVALMGYSPTTKSERGAWNKALADIRQAENGSAPDDLAADVLRRGRCYIERWPGIDLSPMALARHWAEMGQPARLRAPPKSPLTTQRMLERMGGEGGATRGDQIPGPS